ncbi:DnaJ subfamily C member 8 [Cryptotrichosporon argae]
MAQARNAGDGARYAEVERILAAFKLNPYDILDLPWTATESEIKKAYRKKSLLIHPDKFKHEHGEEAFDYLKKAESQLSEKRAEIDMKIKHARSLLLKSILGDTVPANITDDDPKLANLKPPFEAQLRAKTKAVLIEDEMSKTNRVKVAQANEAAEKAKLDEEKAARKRKAEEAVKWEERREERVTDWRQFTKKPKKSNKKAHILG